MQLPNEYRTGNAKMDEKILKALLKDPVKKNKLQVLQEQQDLFKEKNPRIRVGAEDKRIYIDGTKFASVGEMNRWDYLLKVQYTGEIRNLRRQVPFVLQRAKINPQYGSIEPILYVADFTYYNVSFRKEYPNQIIVEDYKGAHLTDVYKLKKKMFLYKYPNFPFFEV